jgi:hypothetical protein
MGVTLMEETGVPTKLQQHLNLEYDAVNGMKLLADNIRLFP